MTRTARQKQIRKLRQTGKDPAILAMCPNPKKSRFATRELAYRYALKSSKGIGPVKVYRCKCQGWHLTTKR